MHIIPLNFSLVYPCNDKQVDGQFAGMAPSVTECNGLLVAASKLDSSDTDGAAVAAGNSTFTLPANFSNMANISVDATVEAAAQVIVDNPYRGESNEAINTDITSLSMLIGTYELPVHNLTAPIQIRIPIKALSSTYNATKEAQEAKMIEALPDGEIWGRFASGNAVNVTCSGDPSIDTRMLHQCPGSGPLLNYTCAVGLPYEITLTCDSVPDHSCVFWDTTRLAWSSEGCTMVGVVASGIPNEGFILCNCTHLTDFSSQVSETLELAANVVGSIESLSLLDVLKNILVLIVLLVVYGSMVVACVYGRYLDRIDAKKVVPFAQLQDTDGDGVGDHHQEDLAKTSATGSLVEVVEFVTKGDGTDYGQPVDMLTPNALTRRAQQKLLKFRFYSDQSEALARGAKTQAAQLFPWRKNSASVAPLPPLEPTTRPGQPHSAEANMAAAAGAAFGAAGHAHEARKKISHSKVVPFNGSDPVSPGGAATTKEPPTLDSHGKGWAAAKRVHRKALTVDAIQQLLAKTKKSRGLRGSLVLEWLAFVKKKHRFLSIFYTKDLIYTRPKRIMVLTLFFLFTMANNCFLFIFAGNANKGDTPEEVMVNQTRFMIIAAICQAPVMGLVTLLFKRSSQVRPEVEDRWVGAAPSTVPRKVRRAVKAREEVFLGQRAVRKAKDDAAENALMLRLMLESAMKNANNQGRAVLTEDEELELIAAKQKMSAVNDKDKLKALHQLEKASEHFKVVKADQQKWVDSRVIDLLGDPKFEVAAGAKPPLWVRCIPCGLGPKLAFYLAQRGATAQAKKDLLELYQSKEERALERAEKQQLESFGSNPVGLVQKLLYAQFLNPLEELKKVLKKESFMPWWVVYVTHGFCLLLGLFCTYYTFLFSVMLNKCAKCGPEGSLDDDNAENCDTCPATMRENNNPGQDLAVDWLLTLLYTMLFNMLILQPLNAGVKAAVYPVIANAILRVPWDKYLTAGGIDGNDDLSDDEDDEDDDEYGEGGGVLGDVADEFLLGPPEERAKMVKPGMSRLLDRLAPLKDAAAAGVDSAAPVDSDAPGGPLDRNSSRSPARSASPEGFQDLFATSGGGAGESKAMESPTSTGAMVVTADGSVTQLGKTKKKKKENSKRRGESSGSGSGGNSDRSRSQSASRSHGRGGGGGGQGALVPLVDPDPPWSCACGFRCTESGRCTHLRACRLFGRSWRAAFHALAQGVQQQKKAVQQAQATGGGEGGGGGRVPRRQPMPLSIEQRLVALDKKVAHFVAKRSAAAAAAASDESNNTTITSVNPSSPSAKRAVRWWDRGLLLAALVESGGDVRRAAAKLCQGSGSASGGDKGNGSLLAAEAYRAEMRFVAESVELVKMLAEHNELLQLTEM